MADLMKNAGMVLVLRGFGAGLAFLLNVAIARLLSLEGTGLYFLALGFVSVLTIIARFGIDHALLRLVATEAAHENWAGVRAVFRLGTRFVLIAGGVFMVATIALAPVIAADFFDRPALQHVLLWIAPSIVGFSLMMSVSESLRGLDRFRDAMLVSGVLYPLCAILMIWPLITLLGVSGAAFAYTLGTGMAAGYGFWVWRKAVADFPGHGRYELKALWSVSSKLYVTSFVNGAIMPWVPLLVLGAVSGAEESGMFGVATRLAILVSFLLTAVTTVLAPKLAKLAAADDRREMQRLTSRVSLYVLLATSPIFYVMFFHADVLMGLFGEEFTQGAVALSIIAMGPLFTVLFGPIGYLLIMSGNEGDVRNGSILSGIVLVTAAFVLIPPYGLVGAAVANVCGLATMHLYSAIIVRIRLGIWVYPR